MRTSPELQGRLLAHAFLGELEKIASVPGSVLKPVSQILAPAQQAVTQARNVAHAAQPGFFGRLTGWGRRGRAFNANLQQAQAATRTARGELSGARRQALDELATPGLAPERAQELNRYLADVNATPRPAMPNMLLRGQAVQPTMREQLAGGLRSAATWGVPLALAGGAAVYAGSRYLRSQDPYAQQ